MNRLLRLILGVTALVGFLLSMAVHFTALSGVDVASHVRGVWLLHGGIFLVFVPFVFYARYDLGTQPSLGQVSAVLPRWVGVVGLVIFVYAIANFLIFIAGTEGGSPAIQDGKYLLLNHGSLIRELTAAEYSAFQANVVRGFSGHWLVFFFVPAAYFLLGPKSKF
jgi:hypothetical protein